MIKFILFDMGNVLLGFHPHRILAQYTSDINQQQRIHRALFSSVWMQLDAGSCTLHEAHLKASKQLSVEDTHVLHAFLHGWYQYMEPLPGMDTLVSELKAKGHRLILVSNASIQFSLYQKRFAILDYFERHFISGEIKKMKPHRDYFEHVLAELNTTSDACLFIDDLHQNVEGAKTLDIESLVFIDATHLRNELTLRKLL